MTAAVSVGSLLGARGASGLDLDLLAGATGLERRITLPYIQKTGLALAGFDEYLRAGRILILGESEIRFLEQLTPERRTQTLRRLFRRDLPCVMVTAGLETPAELTAEADRADVPLMRTALPTAMAIGRLTSILEDRMAPRELRHGVLLDILGLGVFITGESGIGKSECALDLVVRGHRLVADDTVEIRCRGQSILIGTCPEMTRHHIEIRGIGLINVTDLFGVSATRSSKRIELLVQLERWDAAREYRPARPRRRDDGFAWCPGAARDHAGRAGTERRDARGGRGAQPDSADARAARRAVAGRAARAAARAARRSGQR